MLVGFSGYDQVLVREEYQLNIAFPTPWGTYNYLRIPFRLTNGGSTFQHTMDYDFRNLVRKIIEIYRDDLTAISKKRTQHIHHLQAIFERCREYGVSLY
jgi:hypothetical protein